MSASLETRISVLDSVLDATEVDDQFTHELFAVVDGLDRSATLRRVLTDPATPAASRSDLARGLFSGKVSNACAEFVAAAAGNRWPGGRTFAAALERQALRAQLILADRAGHLSETEDELFRFSRLVESDSRLRIALSERSIDRKYREELVGDLLSGKATLATVVLAKRAVGVRERTYGHTLASYINLAAAQRNRVVATVRVARPLSAAQRERLQAGLARQIGREVAIQVLVEPELIGGVRVEFADEVIDGTVAGRLAEARKVFG